MLPEHMHRSAFFAHGTAMRCLRCAPHGEADFQLGVRAETRQSLRHVGVPHKTLCFAPHAQLANKRCAMLEAKAAAAAAVDPRTPPPPPRHSLDGCGAVANGDTGSSAGSDVGSPTRSSRCFSDTRWAVEAQWSAMLKG